MTNRVSDALVEVRDLRTYFDFGRPSLLAPPRTRDAIRAVDGVDLTIRRGEIMGLVGESGSGKTTLGRTMLRLLPVAGGRVVFDGEDITRLYGRRLRRLRRRMQMVFQDPHASLSPRLRVSRLLTEPYVINQVPPKEQTGVSELLDMVELPAELAINYPHELSGGQARRVGIARALSLRPDFLVADEPTAGLDVSAAGGIVNLLRILADRFGLTYVIITHNLNLVAHLADRIVVMYLGKIVELGPADHIFHQPTHPYTLALLSSLSEPDPRSRKRNHRMLVASEIPSPKDPPPGCRFNTRCPFAEERCSQEVPALERVGPNHLAACHFWDRIRAAAPAVVPPHEERSYDAEA